VLASLSATLQHPGAFAPRQETLAAFAAVVGGTINFPKRRFSCGTLRGMLSTVLHGTTITLAVAWIGYDVRTGPLNQTSTTCPIRRSLKDAFVEALTPPR
jgi:hypothetical protein